MSVYQRTSSNGSDLGNGGTCVGTAKPGMGQPPGSTDVAAIQAGEGRHGTLDGAALDLVQASLAPTVSAPGSSTQAKAAPVEPGCGFTLDTRAFLLASYLRIVGGGPAGAGETDAGPYRAADDGVLASGAGGRDTSLLVTCGDTAGCVSMAAGDTLDAGSVRSQALRAATLPAAGDGRLAVRASLAGAALALGLFAAGQPARLHPSGPAPLPEAAPIVLQNADVRVLRDRAEAVRAQLLARPGVAGVTLEGLGQQGVAIDYAPRRLAALGISPQALAAGLQVDDRQSRPGHLQLAASGPPVLQSVADRQVQAGRQRVRLGDVALVSRVRLDPPVSTFQVKGVPAVLVRVTAVQ